MVMVIMQGQKYIVTWFRNDNIEKMDGYDLIWFPLHIGTEQYFFRYDFQLSIGWNMIYMNQKQLQIPYA